MDQSQSRTIRYAVTGLCGLALLLLLGWLVLREPASTSDQSAKVAAVAPSPPPAGPLFTPDEDVHACGHQSGRQVDDDQRGHNLPAGLRHLRRALERGERSDY